MQVPKGGRLKWYTRLVSNAGSAPSPQKPAVNCPGPSNFFCQRREQFFF